MATATPPLTPPAAPAARIPSAVFVEVVRLLIVAVFTAAGHQLAGGRDPDVVGSAPLVGAALGACLGYVHGGMTGRFLRRVMGRFEETVERAPAAAVLAGTLGGLFLGGIGMVVGGIAVLLAPAPWGWSAVGLCGWVGAYAGFQTGARKGDELLALLRGAAAAGPDRVRRADVPERPPLVLVDSSAAIDGRLLAVAGSGFLPGTPAVPRFVLDELQGLSDAADAGRRRRGRRALESLDALQADPTVGLVVLDDEVPERVEVDAKLVVLAGRLGAHLLTVDSGLQRVAELQGVTCLNLHRLAVSVQPVLVPGEVVRLTVSRNGRDPGQGVGFLEDGTMVVVSDGRELVGREADVCITSSVQTSKGRMFFASPAA